MSAEASQAAAAGSNLRGKVAPIPLLEAMRNKDKTWEKIASRYGVTNPDPPWKVSLYATCECLAAGEALPALERRRAEDQLGETLYRQTPAPEQQLLALAHIMLSRGLLSEEELARRMRAVRSRLEAPPTDIVGFETNSGQETLAGNNTGCIPAKGNLALGWFARLGLRSTIERC